MENSELAKYSNKVMTGIVADVLAHTLSNPKETKFLMDFKKNSDQALKIRTELEKKGQHVPAFLICSITNSCNLFCKGCYARSNGVCSEESSKPLLTPNQWADVFRQARDLGMPFVLLAGGEPLLSREVLDKAAGFRDMIFPIFTNGTLINDQYVRLFDDNRNLVPVLSLEGNEAATDSRRGAGVYTQLLDKMSLLRKNKILFGTAITVTRNNLSDVTAGDFVSALKEEGCRVVIYVEYVPVDGKRELSLSQSERSILENSQKKLRERYPSVLFLSFPGDEKEVGGCVAAGRGFFHINPYGDTEPCPFSPYSDRSILTHTLLEALQSPFFKLLQDKRLVGGEHDGGCALFEQEDEVRKLLGRLTNKP